MPSSIGRSPSWVRRSSCSGIFWKGSTSFGLRWFAASELTLARPKAPHIARRALSVSPGGHIHRPTPIAMRPLRQKSRRIRGRRPPSRNTEKPIDPAPNSLQGRYLNAKLNSSKPVNWVIPEQAATVLAAAHLAPKKRTEGVTLPGRTSAVGVRREKAALSIGCKSHPATAPAGSNRSRHGGDEMSEAFGKRVTKYGDRASVQAATRVNAEQASKRTMCR